MENVTWDGKAQPGSGTEEKAEEVSAGEMAPAGELASTPEYPAPQAWAAVLPIPKAPAPFRLAEWLLLASFVLTGFAFFECELLFGMWAGYGATLFFLLPLASTAIYLQKRKIKQGWHSWLLFAAAILGALPFGLYGLHADMYLNHLFIEACLCLLWLAASCRSLIAAPVSWLLAFDWVNQCFVIPFANIGYLFQRMQGYLKAKRSWLTFFITLGVLTVSLPLLMIVLTLLGSSDAGFADLLTRVSEAINIDALIRWLTNLILGLPIAYYLCCVVIGNVDARQTGLIRKDRLLSAFSGFHLIPRAALIASLVLFITVYLVYIAMMGGYLFSALFGELPDGFTYAEYARRGFFELLAVAVINAVIIGTLWLLAKREALEHPALLRALTAILAFLTLLLVTAAAKMHLYVQNYNLTLLRFYCCCFLLVLAVSYILLLVWCLRPFNLGRPVIALFVCIFLVMVLVNPPALIAGFNTERYLSGATPRIDIEMLEQYGVDALPSLQRLSDEAPERTQRDQADQAILRIQERVYEPGRPWYRRNLDYQLKGVYDWDKR